MNTALILAAGVGQRMRNAGRPKQFLKIMNKPIIIYTLEKFDKCEEIDNVIIACHGSYIQDMEDMIQEYRIKKVSKVFVGGNDRQTSICRGIEVLNNQMEEAGVLNRDAILVIHDGVRPLVDTNIISENVFTAKKYGSALTVHSVKESVVITDSDNTEIENFKERSKTYSLTSPQSFRFDMLKEAFEKERTGEYKGMPLLDAAMVFAKVNGKVHLVKEQGSNIKITTPEDFYYLRAILELEEQKGIFGL